MPVWVTYWLFLICLLPRPVRHTQVFSSLPQVSVDVLHTFVQLLQFGPDDGGGWSHQGKWLKPRNAQPNWEIDCLILLLLLSVL